MSVLDDTLRRVPQLTPDDLKQRRYDVKLTLNVEQVDGNEWKQFHESTFSFSSMNYHDVLLIEAFLLGMLGDLVKVGGAMWEAASHGETSRAGAGGGLPPVPGLDGSVSHGPAA